MSILIQKKDVDLMRMMKEVKGYKGTLWQVFEMSMGKCHLLTQIKQTQMKEIIQKEKIELIGIRAATYGTGAYDLYINPKDVIILPDSLYDWILQKPDVVTKELCHEETAVTVEENVRKERIEVICFLDWFYKADSMMEAYKRYEIWQYWRPICQELGNHLVEFVQLHEREVFNVFKFPECLLKE